MSGLTEAERDDMRHALGLNRGKEAYRNHYAASPDTNDDALWKGLCAKGFAERLPARSFDGHLNIYYVTDAGRRALAGPDKETG